jgi:eukaryotic-like serine/threonine-protein kinase
MECPHCHSLNYPAAARCSQCDMPLECDGSTLATTPGAMTPATEVGKSWFATVGTPAIGSLAATGTPIAAGTVLGMRYEILQLLGQGGMGAVYKARDRELDRFLALKVIRPELAVNPEILHRFKQELILARQVTHTNVIRIFDLGEADGIKFITMELIDGQDLKNVLTHGKLSTEESVRVMEQVCLALEAAHRVGVVHRDLKPQNIMLDKSGRVSVMDFGLARSTQMDGMTQTGILLGTPEYMSPEQVMGKHVDARSDLFTLGVIFYQLLTGDMPYKAESAQEAMFKRTRERPKPAVEADPTRARNPSVEGFHLLMMQVIESKDITLGDLFNDFYVVPNFQREYVWGPEEVEQLLEDINAEFISADCDAGSEYFIGKSLLVVGQMTTYFNSLMVSKAHTVFPP